ncbi:helix-turn-helix domain-containing protein [Blautia stercoris]|uniref:helix-turn-helix domain-containing protein n=1 Tax=Blautia stercoris TaxID=871664 RepID=UPI00355B416C
MDFNYKLNEYMERLSCTARELCSLSGISAASFSRYRNGERVPELGTKPFEGLCSAIAQIAVQKGITDITTDSVKASFLACEDFVSIDKEILRQNFNTLLIALNINLTRLCQYINYDASAIFRIRNGTRNPGNSEQFASAVASFVARENQTLPEISAVAELIGCTADKIQDISVRHSKIKGWLLERRAQKTGSDSISEFLHKLDEFDLNEYIKVIKFDELKVPSVPFQVPTSKTYWGIEEMMESELDFLKATVLSKSMTPVIMYSDMPMKEMAKDPDFPKKWMFGMAMMMKKGLHLNQIHNLDRSFDEMMLGLESWIPMYMTGQISPYYFKNAQNNVFLHLLKVSGAAALSGEAIAGYHSDGKYYLTKSKREVEYYRKRAEKMLKNAYPLMDIYRSEQENKLSTFLLSDVGKAGNRRSIYSTLPLYTISEELLNRILTRNGVGIDQKDRIKKYAAAQRQRVLSLLSFETLEDEVPTFRPSDFKERPPVLELSALFYETDITYSEEEYTAHLRETMAFAEQNMNYTVKCSTVHAFDNLQILIHEGSWAMVSKGISPAIHFVIRHPKLRSAIENFIPPITEIK